MPGLGGPLAPHARPAVLHRDRRGGPRTRRRGPGGRAGVGLGEALAVWGLYALQATATLVTYARLPAAELYAVERSGDLAGGLGRTLVLLNWPLALGAVALAAVAGGPKPLVAAALVLCAVTAVPGVVDQADLDARWVNALPALGVLLALALTVAAVRRHGAAFARDARGDLLRLGLGFLLLLLALPWLAAEAGFHFPGDVFLGEERPERAPELAAVHLGFHHGTGGVLLALTALLLSRAARSRLLAAYLSLLLVYGLANAFQDGWNEQLWKRGTVGWHAPDVLRPEASPSWLLLVAAAVAVYVFWLRPRPPEERTQA